MQVASGHFSAPLPHSHYHSYYQLHPPGPQDHELKRQYLALLPPQQIIEICLTFDIHVPPYVKSTIWPPDINAAIAGLQKEKNAPPAVENASEGSSKDGTAIMDSLKSPLVKEPSLAPPESTPTTEPQPPDKEVPSTPGPPSTSASTISEVAGSSTSPAQAAESNSSVTTSNPPQSTYPGQSGAPVQPDQPVTQPTHPTQPPYPHQPYGYGHPQAAYPHTPYYQPPPAGYAYPYASYAPPIQNGYHHPQPPPTYPAQQSLYNSMVPLPHPPQQEGAGADDLPSYEEMIVEALTDCTDPEGWAPKDLFTWMASRYPLQSNFRPSASQALQKAFKRGRFEKSSNGRYRLNATWEGGPTSRRTTRRPQTHNSLSTGSSSTPAPPFTHAPLVHHNHNHSSSSTHATTTAQQSYPYGYSYPGYSSFNAQSNALSPTAAASTSAAASSSSTAAKTAQANVDGDSADAYEAAQNILKAINFGSLFQLPPEELGEDHSKDEQATQQSAIGSGVENLLSHVQAILAANAAPDAGPQQQFALATRAGTTAMLPPQPPVNNETQSEPRAELQAQLALLAAQLAELAQTEGPPGSQDTQLASTPASRRTILPPAVAAFPPPPPPPSVHALIPSPTASALLPAPTPVPPAPSVADMTILAQAQAEEDEESDDDDMEEVI